MSWDGGASGRDTVHERAMALRERYAEQQEQAALQQRVNMNQQRTPTGIVRSKLSADEAKERVGSLNRKLDEALDEVRVAFDREEQAKRHDALQRGADARRAPVLDRPRGGQ